jgi:hypothetical protein
MQLPHLPFALGIGLVLKITPIFEKCELNGEKTKLSLIQLCLAPEMRQNSVNMQNASELPSARYGEY